MGGKEMNETPRDKTFLALMQSREMLGRFNSIEDLFEDLDGKPCPPLNEDRRAAERQFKSLWMLFKSTEQRLVCASQRISELEKELKMVDREEVEGLYLTIEMLTNELEGKDCP